MSRLRKRLSHRARRTRVKTASPNHLYPLRVVEEDEERKLVKVHYEGYSANYDEWRPRSEIIDLQPDDETGRKDDVVAEDTDAGQRIAPLILSFNLHHELMVGINQRSKEKPTSQVENAV